MAVRALDQDQKIWSDRGHGLTGAPGTALCRSTIVSAVGSGTGRATSGVEQDECAGDRGVRRINVARINYGGEYSRVVLSKGRAR